MIKTTLVEMKNYNFAYTRLAGTLLFMLSICIGAGIITYLCVLGKMEKIWIFLIPGISGVALFRLFRKTIARFGTAAIHADKVIFDLQPRHYEMEYGRLAKHKYVDSGNGPVLYLKDDAIKMRLEANNNFCDSGDFERFCNDLMEAIALYKNENPNKS